MAGFTVMEEFHIEKNEAFLEKARGYTPKLKERPVRLKCWRQEGERDWQQGEESLSALDLRPGSKVILDFGEHVVGYLTLSLSHFGSHPDAPALLELRFAEMLSELSEEGPYQGWLGKGWIPQERVHVDRVFGELSLPRRYSCRYVSLEVIDTSPKYGLRLMGEVFKSVSAVSEEELPAATFTDSLLSAIDKAATCTLRDCMQEVFEDGTKRDQRLWLGDVRLEALANYATYRNLDLVKRCLYLFAGLPFNGGKLSACLFTEPVEEPDDTFLGDFSVLFGRTLADFYEETGDREVLADLYPTALRQLQVAVEDLEERGVCKNPGEAFTQFIDWGEGLDKQCAATGALLYGLESGEKLAGWMGDKEAGEWARLQRERIQRAAKEAFYEEELGLFVSGPGRQLSWASQIWMVLGGVLPVEENRRVLIQMKRREGIRGLQTPYAYHYYIEALLSCGEKNVALEEIKRYWGGMILDGADTFWELYDLTDKNASPYGSLVVNSYCHGWSCTPSYFLRRYFCQ